jgi:adenosine deaminase
MKVVFRYSLVTATELDPEDLSLKEFEVRLEQGSVISVQNIQELSAELVNIVVNDNLTYWNVPRSTFEIIGDQSQMQASRCCG